MSTAINNNSAAKDIFGSTPKVLKTSHTLLRLVKLDHALELKGNRQKTLNELASIWIDGRKALASSSPSQVFSLVDPRLQKMGSNIHAIYGQELKNAKTVATFEKCFGRFIKDAKSTSIAPLKKSQRGYKGPTLLVSYPRLDKDFEHSLLKNFVVKWTDWNEICSQRIYDAFLQSFLGNDLVRVPAAAAIDFDHKIHEMTDGSHTPLTPEIAESLRNAFFAIAKIKVTDPDSQPKNEQVMLSERISGENLFDFAQTKYQFLTVLQKETIFHRLGQIAMLDVLMGNLDRLIQIYENKGQYCLDDLEANLGNVMVHWSQQPEESLILYAIDNGIDAQLIDSSAHKKQYLLFLNQLFEDSDMEMQLATTMLESFKHALLTQADDVSDGNVAEIRKQLQSFTNDLKSMGPKAFYSGLREMSCWLQKRLIPMWESEETNPLKNHLSWAYPELLQAITERLEAFKLRK